jgi:hypothetical protein
MLLAVGEDHYQEFTAGTIPVKHVLTDEVGWLVMIEHERGRLPAFDAHLEAVRRRDAAVENVDYVVTWSGMVGDESRPTVIRLELKIDGLRARPRLLFEGNAITPLWMLVDGAMLGLLLDPGGLGSKPPLAIWVLGRTPVRDGLRRILTQAGVPRSALLPRRPNRRRRFSPTAGSRHRRGKSRGRARKHGRGDAPRLNIEHRT